MRLEKNEEKDALEARINKFLQRLQELDLIVNPNGMEKKIETYVGKKSIIEMLEARIASWRYNPVDWNGMRDLEDTINLAFLHNAISEGDGLITENEKLIEKIAQLENEKTALQRKLEKYNKRNAELEHEYYVLKGVRFIGDVEAP
jgi:chromosome segregation ATPase